MRKITKNYKDVSFCEVSQKSKQKIQLANVTGKKVSAVSPFFKCREFYSDLLFTRHTGIGYSIYSFDTDKYAKWTGKYMISTYNESADAILEKLDIMNEGLKGTTPPFEMEQLDMEDTLDYLGLPEVTSGFLVKNPEWWNETLIRGSVFTALLRTLSYPNPLDIEIEESYAEACLTQMHKKSFPKLEEYNDTLWKLLFFPALELSYNNCLCMDDEAYKKFVDVAKKGSKYGIHGSSGIYTMWNTLFQYMSRPDPMKNFEGVSDSLLNRNVLGNMLAFEQTARKEANG